MARANCFARSNSDRSPLHDVRNHAWCSIRNNAMRNCLSSRTVAHATLDTSSRLSSPFDHAEVWWSQTGSNRRPHACKARALPAELWPRDLENEAVIASLCAFRDLVPKATADTLRLRLFMATQIMATQKLLSQSATEGEAWWAWEDLNFRPHA